MARIQVSAPGAAPEWLNHARLASTFAEKAREGDGVGAYDTTLTMSFKALEGQTLVIIEEAHFGTTAGQRASYGNCEGWTGTLCAIEVFLENGIDLREGLYR